jgi:hypothetical protein
LSSELSEVTCRCLSHTDNINIAHPTRFCRGAAPTTALSGRFRKHVGMLSSCRFWPGRLGRGLGICCGRLCGLGWPRRGTGPASCHHSTLKVHTRAYLRRRSAHRTCTAGGQSCTATPLCAGELSEHFFLYRRKVTEQRWRELPIGSSTVSKLQNTHRSPRFEAVCRALSSVRRDNVVRRSWRYFHRFPRKESAMPCQPQPLALTSCGLH